MKPSVAGAAREKSGLSLAEAARRVNRSARHLREVERGTKPCPFHLAGQLAALYNCRMEIFLAPRHGA